MKFDRRVCLEERHSKVGLGAVFETGCFERLDELLSEDLGSLFVQVSVIKEVPGIHYGNLFLHYDDIEALFEGVEHGLVILVESKPFPALVNCVVYRHGNPIERDSLVLGELEESFDEHAVQFA